jgi:hypothetical protein
MTDSNRPGGRRPYERISVLKLAGSARVVLGESEPDQDDRRARAATQWSTTESGSRKQSAATIDTPLPPRTQTALSYRVDPALRRQLQGGPSPSPTSRRAAEQPVQARLTIRIGASTYDDKDNSND